MAEEEHKSNIHYANGKARTMNNHSWAQLNANSAEEQQSSVSLVSARAEQFLLRYATIIISVWQSAMYRPMRNILI